MKPRGLETAETGVERSLRRPVFHLETVAPQHIGDSGCFKEGQELAGSFLIL